MKKLNSKYYLIIFCVFYILLIGVMGAYIYHAFQLKCKEIVTTVHTRIDNLEESGILNKYTIKKENEQYRMLLEIVHGKKTLDEFKEFNKKILKAREEHFSHLIDSLFVNEKYEVAVRYDMSQLTLHDQKKELLEAPITLLQTSRKVEKSYKTNTSNWEVQESSERTDVREEEKEYKHHFSLYQNQYIDIKNIISIALLSLLPLLILTAIVAISLLVVYYIAYRTIKQKEKEVDNLYNMVDNVSHEFKLPIATLKYGCNNLALEYQSPTIDLLMRQVNRLDRLQNSLTPYMTSDNNPYTVKDLTQMMDDLRQLYPEVKLYEQWDAQEEVLLDKTKMETILLNLIENSIKYGGTAIQCNISTNDKHYIFSVLDNGIGIAKDQQRDIFKKFYRIREGNIHNTTGLGIGLYQVQQIVESLNGQININSKPQKGTTFIITIPYV
ncbi:ATP-binding protein [Myroides marinus]|uniref:histidine kinase n=1 Tax=Myroides marinus TaxID=703342 RepID=A0A161SAM2_9FLAO|nr:ATP-binding protein [Myroides marinus]KUF43838.1 histidine kinase [Myroides marinus]KZE82619.1 histidine kinase [Myroides marinus]MDM1348539.1 ATP-binding protein [Myroides marinus]MDM1352044.1 ATP-binding protein [Myroides marinus]MDM1355652.1 ATP-binding protein [Myroides marinus]